MLDEIPSAIDATTDASSRNALRRCLPQLSEAISNWGGHALAPGGLVIAGATSRGAVVLHADAGWPPFDEALAARLRQEFAPDAVALALADSIESPSFQGEAIVTGTALLLGRTGNRSVRRQLRSHRGAGSGPGACPVDDASGAAHDADYGGRSSAGVDSLTMWIFRCRGDGVRRDR